MILVRTDHLCLRVGYHTPLKGVRVTHETHSFLSLWELSLMPLCEVCMIYEKSKFGLRESPL
jgi:hypothetical protein